MKILGPRYCWVEGDEFPLFYERMQHGPGFGATVGGGSGHFAFKKRSKRRKWMEKWLETRFEIEIYGMIDDIP